MEQLSLLEEARTDAYDLWLRNPGAAFETWQRSTPHSEGYTYAERSIRQHCAMWHQFTRYLRLKTLDTRSIQSDKIALFLEALTGKDGKAAEDSTKRRYLKLLSAAFEHLKKIGLRQDGNPCVVLFKYYKPIPTRSPAALASQEDERFVDIVLGEEPKFWRDFRDQAMMALIIGSGLYTSEMVALQMDQIILDADPPYIHVDAHGKVPERKAPIAPFAREPLRKWLAIRSTLALSEEQTAFVSGKGGKMLPATLYRKVQSILKSKENLLRPRGDRAEASARKCCVILS